MRIVKFFDLFLLLFLFWLLLTLNITPSNIIIGFLVSLVITLLSYNIIYQESIHLKRIKITRVFIYTFFLFFHIYKSSFTYIFKMFSKNCLPKIIEIELAISKPFIISIIANSITLTPGTVTIDYIDQKLIVLAFINKKHSEDKIKSDIKSVFIKHLSNKEQ